MEIMKIPLGNGINLVAEQGTDPNFSREIYIGLANDNDMWVQDLAIVRQKYKLIGDSEIVGYVDGEYQVLVYSDENDEDYTHKFDIKECRFSSL